MAKQRTSIRVMIGLGSIVILGAMLFLFAGRKTELYATHKSPDGRFSIQVWRKVGGIRFPGASSDAPGFVKLFDSSGRLINEMQVGMVQEVDRIEWSASNVLIAGVADWKLKP
jgi:hypothetical protein